MASRQLAMALMAAKGAHAQPLPRQPSPLEIPQSMGGGAPSGRGPLTLAPTMGNVPPAAVRKLAMVLANR